MSNIESNRIACASLLVFGASFLSIGCQREYRASTDGAATACLAGDYAKASEITTKALKKEGDDKSNRVAYLLEAGRCAQLNLEFESSTTSFGMASELVRPYLESKADASVTEAVATTAVNQTLSEYRATNPERIMLETMLAMNALIQGDRDAARVCLIRGSDWGENARQLNEDEITQKQKEIDESKKSANEATLEDVEKASEIETNENFKNLESLSGSLDYADPFATYLQAVFLASEGGQSDWDAAYFSFNEVARLNAQDPQVLAQVKGDLAALEAKFKKEQLAPNTWIFVLDGLVAYRKELKLAVAAVPYMVQRDIALTQPLVAADGVTQPMVVMSDVDRMVMTDFKQKLPMIIVQEILSTALKTATTVVAQKQFGTAGLLLGVAYQAGSTAADLRSWHTMPKRILSVRVPTPADGVITVRDGDVVIATTTVEIGSSGIVFVNVPARGAPPSVKAAVLCPAAPQQVAEATPKTINSN